MYLPVKISTLILAGLLYALTEKEGSGESIPVFVQTFEGHGAKQLFMDTLEFSRGLVNGHHLNIIGISPSSHSSIESDARYIVYERAHRRDTRRLLAAAIVKGVKETTTIGLRAVYGITVRASSYGLISIQFLNFDTVALAHLFKVGSSISLTQIAVEALRSGSLGAS
ncbi:hypothetical protein BDP27DRAFT_1366208 [Rhodocollybia butyracea]|uniref:Uncharacterized protein n=1 Tax=Rhodocollybia butyracea TaxID=206335 RepID=A0A9P5PHD2_9AGAR|nr:hypothetical protein BDP27DRAFT_1366208 [Rhodocollybia butyracea]